MVTLPEDQAPVSDPANRLAARRTWMVRAGSPEWDPGVVGRHDQVRFTGSGRDAPECRPRAEEMRTGPHCHEVAPVSRQAHTVASKKPSNCSLRISRVVRQRGGQALRPAGAAGQVDGGGLSSRLSRIYSRSVSPFCGPAGHRGGTAWEYPGTYPRAVRAVPHCRPFGHPRRLSG
ncbi:hypothetical protein GCM10009760_35900 [Kitasatospora kazusensis]|uniref:Uncharacterized protein n=1 Tax=Kitasatospora kazusensis TaxID=407974 RepID=A0ABN2ZRA8_9ACTN